jgi:hypothetical protein
MTMKRYLVFAFDEYYPQGGWCDFKHSFREYAQAYDYASEWIAQGHNEYFQIVDTWTMTVI